jgi:DUF917 family protein
LRQFAEHQLEDLAFGAAVLGTGGGGNPYVGMLLAREAILEHGPLTIVDPEEVPDDALVVPAAMMGAPTIMVEKVPAGGEIVTAFRALEEYLGQPITHTVPAEAGGLNSVTPFTLAAQVGIPVVDADMMGRAFPELQMCLPSLYGVSATPMAMADEKGNSVVISTVSNRWTERIARSVTIDMGCSAMIALYAMTGAQLKEMTIPRTLLLAEQIGRAARETKAAHGDVVAAICDLLSGFRLFEGKIVDIARRTDAGFAKAEARIEGIGANAGSVLVLDVQNEHLLASIDDQIAASVPDLIIMLDSESGEPITTEEIRYGFRVTILAAPCDPRWRTDDGLELVGPRYFGYDIDYVPIEERRAAMARRGGRSRAAATGR